MPGSQYKEMLSLLLLQEADGYNTRVRLLQSMQPRNGQCIFME